jgi:hypothetical protein
MITAYRTIALSFGYVESNTTSWLIYHAESRAPSTRQEALYSLVAYLWDKFVKQNNEHHDFSLGYSLGNKCCQRYWTDTKYVNGKKREANPERCPTCEGKYPVTWEFNEEDWQGYLWDLHRSDCNSYGEHDWVENPYGWSPWMYSFAVPQHQMVVIGEHAEITLTTILYELHPELVSKEEGSNYWEDNGMDSPWDRDYDNLMDESCVLDDYSLHYSASGKKPNCPTVTKIIDYPNGGQSIIVDDVITYIKYNTGDEIWLDFHCGKYKVIKIRHGYNGIEYTNFNDKPHG